MVIKPMDWFAPIGLCTGGIGLCVWGAAVNEGTPRIICLITAGGLTAIVVGFLLLRFAATRPDFVLSGPKVSVIRGKENSPYRTDINKWVQQVVNHWSALPKFSVEDVYKALNGSRLFYVDKKALTVWGRKVRGYTQGKDCVIGHTLGKVESLTIHELSHVVLYGCGVPWDEKLHHDIFAKTNLGH